MHFGRKYDSWGIKSHVKVFEDTQTDTHTDTQTDTQTFSKRPNPISGKYFKAF